VVEDVTTWFFKGDVNRVRGFFICHLGVPALVKFWDARLIHLPLDPEKATLRKHPIRERSRAGKSKP
jgi:hypothetical protein